MSAQKNKQTKQNPSHSVGGFTELKISEMKTGETVQSVIYSQPTTSIIVIICFAVLMISMKFLVIVGWLLLIMMMCLFVFGKNKKQLSFYKTFMIIHALDNDDLGWKVDYDSIKFWILKHSFISLSTLTIETMGQNGQKIETRCWNYHALKKALMKAMPSKMNAVLNDNHKK